MLVSLAEIRQGYGKNFLKLEKHVKQLFINMRNDRNNCRCNVEPKRM